MNSIVKTENYWRMVIVCGIIRKYNVKIYQIGGEINEQQT